jgi:hypothetical protein
VNSDSTQETRLATTARLPLRYRHHHHCQRHQQRRQYQFQVCRLVTLPMRALTVKNAHYQPAGYNPPKDSGSEHMMAPSTPSPVKSSSRRSRSTPGIKSTTTMDSDLSQNLVASTISDPGTMTGSGGASSSHIPILPLRSEVAEELENSGATVSNDSEAEDGDEKEMFTWKEELLNHSINEGSLPYTDAGSSSEVDYSAKMELHSHHRYSISGKCIQSTT